MAERTPEERELLEKLKRKHPGDFDRVMNLYGALSELARPKLIKATASQAQGGINPEDVVSEVIEKGFLTIYVAMGGILPEEEIGSVKPAKNFIFDEDSGLTFYGWLKRLLGAAYPALSGGDNKLGILWTHNRRQGKRAIRETELTDAHENSVAETDDGFEDMAEMLSPAIAGLNDRQRFIVEARYGLPLGLGFHDIALARRAKMCGLPPAKLKARAKRAQIDPEAAKLQVQEIAALLDLSVEQVGRDCRAAKKQLLAFYRAHQNAA